LTDFRQDRFGPTFLAETAVIVLGVFARPAFAASMMPPV
jgi:hypothetical protein